MTACLQINLCVVQPAGRMDALGLVDAALYVQHQFQRLGADVTLSKNRLMRQGVNLVFGAHLGFDPALKRDYTCLFVNLEQVGHGGAKLPLAYMELLRHSLVIDHHPANLAAYGASAEDVPLISFGHAPYLPKAPIDAAAIAARPIDLLFIGAMNERRAKLIARIETCGRQVTTLNAPVYGPERDVIVAQARGVLGCHFYPSARFEQATAFQTLSLGTPLVAERTFGTEAGDAFDTCSLWFEDLQLERFFTDEYGSPLYFEVAAKALEVFQQADPLEAYADCLAFALGVHKVERSRRSPAPRAVKRLHLGSRRDCRAGWFNIDLHQRSQPDLVLDLGQPQTWPMEIDSPTAGRMLLAEGTLDEIQASNMLEHVPDLAQMMSHCLALLKTGGTMTLEVPHERAPGAWQDPTHVRAMNDHSWRCYTDWFWTLGWFSHRFEKTAFQYLDHRLAPCEREAAWFMRVELTKVETTLAERMTARTQRADFGPLYDTRSTSNGDKVQSLSDSTAPHAEAARRSAPQASLQN